MGACLSLDNREKKINIGKLSDGLKKRDKFPRGERDYSRGNQILDGGKRTKLPQP